MRSTRITALAVAAALVAAALLGGASTSAGGSSGATTPSNCDSTPFPRVIRDGFPNPPMRFSRNGRLDTRLRMGTEPVTIAGRRYEGAQTYEGTFPGPTLVICPGDDVRVRLVNRISTPTNLHVHGLHVSPRGDGDNVYRELSPLRSQTYDYALPDDHEPGAYWYHPHHHMFVAPQIFAGLSGAIVVRGGLDKLLAGVPQRLMMIQSTELCGGDGRSVPFPITGSAQGSGSESCSDPGTVIPVALTNERFTPLLVNGAINPTARIRPGEIQRWRIFNANDNRIVDLKLRGQSLQVLAEDGNTLRRMRPATHLRIGPGSRRELLVRGGPPGSYPLTALPFAQFPGGDKPDRKTKGGGPTPNQTVLTVVSSGRPAHDRFPRGELNAPVDLRAKHVDRSRTICFNERPVPAGTTAPHAPDSHEPPMAASAPAADGNCVAPRDDEFTARTDFLINGMTFDPAHVAVTMKLDSVEEWTLVNANTEWHTFHIHVNPFQVVSVNGVRTSGVLYEDNVALAPKSRTVIRMNPVDFTGKFVIHCHVANHEDRGMMAAVQVLRHPSAAQLAASAAGGDGMSMRSGAYRAGHG
jgi:FtsP/CotA-like multicopper oxidase with cupredoxin domain